MSRGWDIINLVHHAMLEAKVAVVMIPIPRLDTGLNRDQGLRQVTDKVVMHITLKMGHMGAVNGLGNMVP